ncbi:MAG: mannose-1-phosphate guanyltransferase [Hyperionvirus sp.]|uniref:Mannose-1-phosphate guanyltransferase n=1 Tax=Hyperionvirus sp. TaxID=2487770 RepID=A0A3G5A624_9VIRU|nr:MAG: mannose-1-phosphate guanyltransferase [Hyperionvirus sp.]
MSQENIRPWGHYDILAGTDTSGYKIKRIIVNPHQKLSLQSHNHRKEVWTVINGAGEAIKGDTTIPIQTGDTVIIEIKEHHRLINNTDSPLEIIEIQLGDYLGEDDITRYSDDYGRIP